MYTLTFLLFVLHVVGKSHDEYTLWGYWDPFPLTPFLQTFVDNWHRMNENNTIVILNEANKNEYISRAPPSGYANWAPQMRADWVRTAVIAEHGGFWADTSILFLQPLKEIVPSVDEFFGFGPTVPGSPQVENWFFFAPEGSEIMQEWLEEYELSLAMGPKSYVKLRATEVVGTLYVQPYLFHQLALTTVLQRNNITLALRDCFTDGFSYGDVEWYLSELETLPEIAYESVPLDEEDGSLRRMWEKLPEYPTVGKNFRQMVSSHVALRNLFHKPVSSLPHSTTMIKLLGVSRRAAESFLRSNATILPTSPFATAIPNLDDVRQHHLRQASIGKLDESTAAVVPRMVLALGITLLTWYSTQ